MKELTQNIVDAVSTATQETLVSPIMLGGSAQNEMLFFFKPECFLGTTKSQQCELVNTALDLFLRFGAIPAGAMIITGRELGERNIMDRHYGFINRVSRAASTLLPATDVSLLKETLQVPPSTPVLGGHEFLERYGGYDAGALDRLWATKRSRKLRSGLYFESYDVNGESIVIVNGFHPSQLLHFTAEDRKIAIVVLQSDLPWKILRSVMLGDTFPDRALPGSFRRILHENPGRFGLPEVSIAANASHLSAGPFEAMFELWNFLVESKVVKFTLEATRMSALARSAGANEEHVKTGLQNPAAYIGGVQQKLFDATEEIDAESAAHLFVQVYCDL